MKCNNWAFLIVLIIFIRKLNGTPIQNTNHETEVIAPAPCPFNYTWQDYSCVAMQTSCAQINCSEIQQGQQQIKSIVGTQSASGQYNAVQSELLLNRFHRLFFPRPRQAFAIEPKSYNPQLSCRPGYQYNGKNCIQTITLEAKCPDEYALNDGRCIHTITGTCPSGFALINSVCVGDVEYQAECPDSYKWNGAFCVHTMDVCPPGYNLTDGICQRAIIGFCPVGTYLKDNKCIQQSVKNVQCDEGYTWSGLECVQYSDVCESGYRLVNNQCEKILISDEEPLLACNEEFELREGECVSTAYLCPNGFEMDADGKNCVERSPLCPNGYEYNSEQSICQQTSEEIQAAIRPVCPESFAVRGFYCQHYDQKQLLVQLICPNGYSAINSICVFDQHLINTSMVRPYCPADYEFINHTCRRHLNTSQQLTVPPVCPSGYLFSNSLCILLIDNVTPVCPMHYAYNEADGACVRNRSSSQLQTAPATCPDNFILSHHICVQQQQQQQHMIVNLAHTCQPYYNFNFTGTTCAETNTTEAATATTVSSEIPNVSSEIKTLPPSTTEAPEQPQQSPIVLPTVCPFGYEWLNGTCHIIQPICPDGFSYYAKACYRIYNANELQRGNNNNAEHTRPPAHATHNNHNSPNNNGNDNGEILLEFSITNTINNNNTIYTPINVNISNRVLQVEVATARPPASPTTSVTTTGNNNWQNGISSITSNHFVNSNQHEHEVVVASISDAKDDANRSDSRNAIPAMAEKCCEILSPRQCKLADNSDGWICDHQRYQTCAEYCSQPKLYLRARRVQYVNSVLTMPPPPRRWWKVMNTKMLQLNGISES